MHHKFLDEHSDIDSWLHTIDPRVKVVVFFSIIIAVMAVPFAKPLPLILYGLLAVFFLAASKLPLSFVGKRLLGILPFVLVIALSFFFQSPVNRFFFLCYVMSKAALSILCMILLVSTTHFVDLLKGFQKLRCPGLLIMVFSFMYRYLYLFIDELMKMNQAREARSVGHMPWLKARTLANIVGHLFIRSYERGEGVYLAMCARGYTGQARTMHEFALQRKDYIFVITVFLYLAVTQAVNYVKSY
ncbi:MAG TPA: cobalt ECF transporter T component CbiQ [Candidatus Omnitrophica bacterium]|nr:cobalt ECF transporter T component CbiQ [Candidatus Omnitrophota bacterium]